MIGVCLALYKIRYASKLTSPWVYWLLNGDATQFIHVHPASEDVPEFEAQFPFPGFYKLWVEFKFADSGVPAFPFIVEVS